MATKGKWVNKTGTVTLKNKSAGETAAPKGLKLVRDGTKFTLTFKAGGKTSSTGNGDYNNKFSIEIYGYRELGSLSRNLNASYIDLHGVTNVTISPSSGTYSYSLSMHNNKLYPNVGSAHLSAVVMMVIAQAKDYTVETKKTYYTAANVTDKNKVLSAKHYTKKDAEKNLINKGKNVNVWNLTLKQKHVYSQSTSVSKTFAISKPAKPAVSVDHTNKSNTACSWGISDVNYATNARQVTDIMHNYEVVTAFNRGAVFSHYSGQNHGSFSNSGTSTGTIAIPQNDNAYIVRAYAYARGWGKDSDTASTYRAYSHPNNPTIKMRSISSYSSSISGYYLYLDVGTDFEGINKDGTIYYCRPVDTIEIQYATATPGAGGAIPSISSWSSAITYDNVANGNNYYPSIPIACGDLTDQALYMRAIAYHDERPAYSSVIVVKWGKLSTPAVTDVAYDSTTHRVRVTATNNAADVPGTYLDVYFTHTSNMSGNHWIGTIPHGETQLTADITRWFSETTKSFRVKAVAPYPSSGRMESAFSPNSSGQVPAKPVINTASYDKTTEEAFIKWSASGTYNGYELIWSDSSNMLNGTNTPNSYSGDSLAPLFKYVSGLEIGKIWYFAVRMSITQDSFTSYGEYSSLSQIDLRTDPDKPVLMTTSETIEPNGSEVISWTYYCEDGSELKTSELKLVNASGTIVSNLAVVENKSSYEVIPKNLNWSLDTQYRVVVRVQGGNSKWSAWSDPLVLVVKHVPTATIVSTSLTDVTIDVSEDAPEGAPSTTVIRKKLTTLPLTVTVNGAGNNGTASVYIYRHGSFVIPRPDGDRFYGNEGETAAIKSRSNDGAISIGIEDLIGNLDDGCEYDIVAAIEEEDGRTAKSDPLTFRVEWNHQAVMPDGLVVYDKNALVARIVTYIPESGYLNTDTCDIYRLSTDKPELIVSGGTLGESYVDLYPTFGKAGGYRIVYKTQYGDYVTADAKDAWLDIMNEDIAVSDVWGVMLNFDEDSVILKYDISLSNEWDKIFELKTYLGGSVKGDWNPGITRKTTIKSVSIVEEDFETIQAMRRLAEYSGKCHIRTPDGSSFAADVQVKESREERMINKKVSFDLSITRVEDAGDSAMNYNDYIINNPEIKLPERVVESFDFAYTSQEETFTLAHTPYYVDEITSQYPTLVDSDIPLTELPEEGVEFAWNDAHREDDKQYALDGMVMTLDTRIFDDVGTAISAVKHITVEYHYYVV